MATNYLVENNVIMSTSEPTQVVAANNYSCKYSISINANNAFYGTFWVEKNGQKMTQDLGTASYQVYDADRNALVVLTESGLTADLNGVFRLTPKSAAELIDLTHFDIEVSIYADSELRVSRWGFNLGE